MERLYDSARVLASTDYYRRHFGTAAVAVIGRPSRLGHPIGGAKPRVAPPTVNGVLASLNRCLDVVSLAAYLLYHQG
jgi:hypothetical protein